MDGYKSECRIINVILTLLGGNEINLDPKINK